MSRKPKAYKYFSIKLDAALAEKMEKQAIEKRMSKTAVVETALAEYFERIEKRRKK